MHARMRWACPISAGTSWAFLALMWGLVSDVDLESEACRCFGTARFDIYAAVRARADPRGVHVLRAGHAS